MEIDPASLEQSLQHMNGQTGANIAHLIETIRGGVFSDSFAAVQALSIFGSEAKAAVPVLIEMLNKTSLTNLQPQIVGTALAFSALENLKREAAKALAEMGPDARMAIPALIELARNPRDAMGRPEYCRALGRIGSEADTALPTLLETLNDLNVVTRIAAATAVININAAQASSAVEVLEELQNQPAPVDQMSATVALWRFDRRGNSPVGGLIQQIKDPGASWWAANLLGDLGPYAKDAIPALMEMLRRDSIDDRRKAAIAIRRIDPEAARSLGLPGMLALP
jgi:HEAT repeat protein